MAANNPHRPEPYMERLELDVSNFRCTASPAQAADMGDFFQSLTMDNCVSIQNLVDNPDGDFRNKFIVAVIASITPSSGNNTFLNRGASNTNRRGGGVSQTTYTRLFRFVCVNSSAHNNIFAIMQGDGHGHRLFGLDLTKRDDGTFREKTILII